MNTSLSQIFLSYAREDQNVVSEIYYFLKLSGCNPWMDVEKLLPGQNWEQEIEQAINNSRYFIACLSSLSVNKIGYVQKEFKDGLKRLDYYPEGMIFLVPLRLDAKCRIPPSLSSLQWLDWFAADAPIKLLKVVNPAAVKGLDHLNLLIQTLSTGSPSERQRAVREIGRTHHPRALGVLVRLYRQESDATVKHWIALSMGELNLAEARSALLDLNAWEELQPDNEARAWSLRGIEKALRYLDTKIGQ